MPLLLQMVYDVCTMCGSDITRSCAQAEWMCASLVGQERGEHRLSLVKDAELNLDELRGLLEQDEEHIDTYSHVCVVVVCTT